MTTETLAVPKTRISFGDDIVKALDHIEAMHKAKQVGYLKVTVQDTVTNEIGVIQSMRCDWQVEAKL